MTKGLRAPFPYFGGKGAIAGRVWEILGDVDKYVEPFCGSAAVLLSRPWDHSKAGRYHEVVNDAAHFIVNFWRALKAEPEAVAALCDVPIIEADLHSRQLWLIGPGAEMLKQCEVDPEFYNVQAAAWWAWGASSWIGSNWATDGRHAKPNMTPKGVNRLTHDTWETTGFVPVNIDLREYLISISARLRQVRVLMGDWSRVVKPSEMREGGRTVGVFLDPPYMNARRERGLYYHDGHLNEDVAAWCREWGNEVRIVLAGYEGEYALDDWYMEAWSARRAYASSSSSNRNEENRKQETLWVSPAAQIAWQRRDSILT